MRLCWNTIHVNDMAAATAFYGGALGLREDRRFAAGPGVEIAFFACDSGAEIELIRTEGTHTPVMERNVTIAFTVPDLDAAVRRMEEHGVSILRGPMTLGKDTCCFFVKDPDGVDIQIVAE